MMARGIGLLLALSLIATGLTAAAADPVPLPAYVSTPAECPAITAALAAFRRQQYDVCLRQLDAAVAEFKYLPPARVMLAQMFFSSGDLAHTRSVLEDAANASPARPEVFLLFAQLAAAERRTTDALVHIDKAAQLSLPAEWSETQKNKFLAQLSGGRATVAEHRRDWPEMQRQLENLLKFEPKDGYARQRLAYAMFNANLHAANADDRDLNVFKQLQQAAADVPSLEPPEVALAILYTGVGNHERAGNLLKTAVTEHPKDPRVYVRLASWELDQNHPVDAGKYAAQAAQLGLDSRDLKFLRGLVARQLKEYEAAERFFDAINRESPSDLEAGNQLALVLVEQPQAEKQNRAMQLAESLVRQFPKSADALATLGWVNYKMGRFGQAEQCLRLSTVGGTLNNDSAYYLARVLAEKGASDDATRAQEILRSMIDRSGTLFVTREEARDWLARSNAPPTKVEAKSSLKGVSPSDLDLPEKKKPSL